MVERIAGYGDTESFGSCYMVIIRNLLFGNDGCLSRDSCGMFLYDFEVRTEYDASISCIMNVSGVIRCSDHSGVISPYPQYGSPSSVAMIRAIEEVL